MLKLTYQSLANDMFTESFNKLINLESLSMADAIGISKSIDNLESEKKVYEKTRVELIKKYGVEIKEDDKVISWTLEGASKENIEEFSVKMNELFAVEFEISLKNKIKLVDDGSKNKLSAKDIYILKKIIDLGD